MANAKKSFCGVFLSFSPLQFFYFCENFMADHKRFEPLSSFDDFHHILREGGLPKSGARLSLSQELPFLEFWAKVDERLNGQMTIEQELALLALIFPEREKIQRIYDQGSSRDQQDILKQETVWKDIINTDFNELERFRILTFARDLIPRKPDDETYCNSYLALRYFATKRQRRRAREYFKFRQSFDEISNETFFEHADYYAHWGTKLMARVMLKDGAVGTVDESGRVCYSDADEMDEEEYDANIPLLASKIGGRPDLPDTLVKYARREFLMQINLKEVYDHTGFQDFTDIPRSGMYYFFSGAGWDLYCRDEDEPKIRPSFCSRDLNYNPRFTKVVYVPDEELQNVSRIGDIDIFPQPIEFLDVITTITTSEDDPDLQRRNPGWDIMDLRSFKAEDFDGAVESIIDQLYRPDLLISNYQPYRHGRKFLEFLLENIANSHNEEGLIFDKEFYKHQNSDSLLFRRVLPNIQFLGFMYGGGDYGPKMRLIDIMERDFCVMKSFEDGKFKDRKEKLLEIKRTILLSFIMFDSHIESGYAPFYAITDGDVTFPFYDYYEEI